ncbi:hypothetical protein BCR35DRAFT_309722 [Leucosporidium creatinivorum]|uniref:Uncharacterized protein n=1 Tax=Leucosporidium creatinivorum TaxID=106004 RepID=A0A1Y2DBZ9_9BASI|nr:hypothetical protein BCR35DRAFT_309722 [Leucosporidium creatinivorum]
MSTLSYGASLPDSELLVNSNTTSLISLLPTFSTFLSHRASLSRDYSRKLIEATGKARQQANKEAAERFGRDSSLEKAYASVLEQTDLDAREHAALADSLDRMVADPLMQAGIKLEGVRKKHHAFAGKLLAERDRAYSDRDKSRQRYFESCEALESARQKKAQVKDDRATEKATRSYQLAVEDMEIAKNQFLLSTSLANVSKTRLYNSDLPSLHDDFQLLGASTVNQFVHLLKVLCTVQRESLGRLNQSVDISEGAVEGIQVERDQEMFVTMHSAEKLGGWEVPPDLGFEECPVWHDTDEMSTTPPSVVYLQNIKLRSLSRIAEILPAIDTKRREIGGLRNLRDAYEKDRTLGDAGAVLENLFDSTRETTLLEINQTEMKAQVELIDAALGDAATTTLTLHSFKSSSFVTPAPCAVCASSVWGKGLSCKACQLPVHSKCEMKVPAGCTGRPGAGVTRSGSKRMPQPQTQATSPIIDQVTPDSTSTSAIPPPRRSIPPPTTITSSASALPTATMLYSYTAATAFELSVAEAEVISVVEGEDETGWTKVRTKDGRVGLVPGSYLQLGGSLEMAVGEAGEGAGGGQQVMALYDYDAQSSDELSVREGEYVVLTALGLDAGDGWAEAIKEGRTGLLPVSYLQM